jgi:hypothetical protein
MPPVNRPRTWFSILSGICENNNGRERRILPLRCSRPLRCIGLVFFYLVNRRFYQVLARQDGTHINVVVFWRLTGKAWVAFGLQ